MKYLKIFIFSTFIFVFSFCIIEYAINNNFQDYRIELSTESPNYDLILTEKYWEDIILEKGFDETYNLSSDIFNNHKYEDGYLYLVNSGINYDIANRLLRALVNNGVSNTEFFISNHDIEILDRVNPFILPIVVSMLSAILFFFIFKKEEVDQVNIFTKSYWKDASKESKKIKNLCTISILLSLQLIVGLLPIPSGFGGLKIGISYLFLATNCMFFGPIAALFIGATGDIIGHFISSSSPFFFGYTLNAMLAAFTYALCFYKRRITFVNVFISRLFINLFVNVVLGTLWVKIMYNQSTEIAMINLLFINLPKNLFYLIPQSIILFIVFKSSSKVFNQFGYIDEYQKNVTII